MITVTQVKSSTHAKPKSRGTLRALGLGRIGKTNVLPDRPEIRDTSAVFWLFVSTCSFWFIAPRRYWSNTSGA